MGSSAEHTANGRALDQAHKRMVDLLRSFEHRELNIRETLNRVLSDPEWKGQARQAFEGEAGTVKSRVLSLGETYQDLTARLASMMLEEFEEARRQAAIEAAAEG